MKLAIGLLVFVSVLSKPFNIEAQDNVVACYPLNNDAIDFSGNNYDGVLSNTLGAEDRNGISNKALFFSGFNSSVLIDHQPFLLDTYTVSLWCKPESLPSVGQYYSIFAIGDDSADQGLLIGNNASQGHVGVGFGSYDAQLNSHCCYVDLLPQPGEWIHIVVSRDNVELRLYINEEFVCSKETTGNAGYGGPDKTFRIGSRVVGGFQNFVGAIDDFRIYDEVLTPLEISSQKGICGDVSSSIENNDFTGQQAPIYFDAATRQISLPINVVNYEVYSVTGQMILQGKNQTSQVTLERNIKGILIVKGVTQNGEVISNKILVE